ncbi:Biotin biosynthesis cytochrome P450 [Defluviimonas aquaemixtae]|uniref:Biotin biosynthesis cytochrome P450 n=1 Tax=Albidovulum aquaemixtae TaxID=1542388 RepID=A0A2R8B477_9RHOB|nr:cytochrome P450 [Defluviimonas aquaemixtae]SPH17419.1 Biotin biosynthesis cytochrome P450 [Defluviimonas aquaemixtae]
MNALDQSPTDARFVQNPYQFYERARRAGPLFYWNEYQFVCATSAATVGAILRDRRFGREVPEEKRAPVPENVRPFYAVEAHSMLELEPPRHTRLRNHVLRAFTSRRIAALAPEIAALSHTLIDAFPAGEFDLLSHFAQKLPVIVIARLLGVPEDRADDLLHWSNAMVAMYQARRTRATEDAAVAATNAFVAFLNGYVEERLARPSDDLITHLIAAEAGSDALSTDELISTCILLLNAGHEATVHTLGNGVKVLIEKGIGGEALAPDRVEATVEEILRFDPPLHLFTRHAYDDIEISGHTFRRGDEVGLLLAAANRDPQAWDRPARFNPARPAKANHSFGAGIHFCVGAPLARLELQVALPILFERLPGLAFAKKPRYANLYHFHGLERLQVASRERG